LHCILLYLLSDTILRLLRIIKPSAPYSFGVLDKRMSPSQEQYTATIVFDYAWHVDMAPTQTLRHTKIYANTPGEYDIYDVVINTVLSSPSRLETVGIHFTLTPPGGIYTHSNLATVATHWPTITVPATASQPDSIIPGIHVCKSQERAILPPLDDLDTLSLLSYRNVSLCCGGVLVGLLVAISLVLTTRRSPSSCKIRHGNMEPIKSYPKPEKMEHNSSQVRR
jgi:hypothetical protein